MFTKCRFTHTGLHKKVAHALPQFRPFRFPCTGPASQPTTTSTVCHNLHLVPARNDAGKKKTTVFDAGQIPFYLSGKVFCSPSRTFVSTVLLLPSFSPPFFLSISCACVHTARTSGTGDTRRSWAAYDAILAAYDAVMLTIRCTPGSRLQQLLL